MKKKVIIITSVLGALTVAVLLVCGLVDKFCKDNLTVSDWLAASCSILSLIGTTALAIVAVWQTEKANKQNEALIVQNTELQKINDRQFKIANQQFYPLLEIDNVRFINEDVKENVRLDNWENGISNILDKSIMGSFINIDARVQNDNAPTRKTRVIFEIKNISEAIVKEIEIYKYTCSTPLNNIVDTSWPLYIFTFSKNKTLLLEMDFYHNQDICTTRGNAINFCLFLQIKTVTGVTFYEKLHVWVSAGYSYGEIDELSEEKIVN